MKKQFSCKETVVVNGFKTTRSIVTDDPSVAKTFLENSKVSDNSSKSKTKRTSNKDPGKTTSAKKKDSIKAEVKEIKPKSKSSKKEPKVKTLPAPKKIKVYVNGKYYTTLRNKEELGELIAANNLFECRISIEEVSV